MSYAPFTCNGCATVTRAFVGRQPITVTDFEWTQFKDWIFCKSCSQEISEQFLFEFMHNKRVAREELLVGVEW